MGRRAVWSGSVVPVIVMVLLAGCAPGSSIGGSGAEQLADYTTGSSLSDDGRYAAIHDPSLGVFRIDRVTHEIDPVSVDPAGNLIGTDFFSSRVSISGDGRFVTFWSEAVHVATDTNERADVYRRDLEAGTTQLVTVRPDGSASASLNCVYACLSAPWTSDDGRYVVFASTSAELVAGDTNGKPDVFRRDMVTGVTELVSINATGSLGDGVSFRPSVSDDGRVVAFESHASNLVPGGAGADVLVKDMSTGALQRLSDPLGVTPFGSSPSVDGDGSHVALVESSVHPFASQFYNGLAEVQVTRRGVNDGSVVLVSKNALGQPGDASSYEPSISDNGERVVFNTYSANLIPGDLNNVVDAYVANVASGAVGRVSSNVIGLAPSHGSDGQQISGDGSLVVFTSGSWDLNLEPLVLAGATYVTTVVAG